MSAPGNVSCAVQQPDGKYLLLGSFKRTSTGTIGNLVRLNADFTLDQSFNATVASLQGRIYSVRTLPNGKLLLVGSGPLTLAGISRQNLLRLNADGSPDTTFDAGTAANNGTGLVVEPLASGQLVVGGTFTSYNGVARSHIVRLSTIGSVDATFVPAAFAAPVSRLAVQADGKVLVGGSFSGSVGLRRLNTDGTTDASFAAPLVHFVSDLLIQPDGNIIVGGSLSGGGDVARLLPDGSLDNAFQTNVSVSFTNDYDQRRMLLQGNGYIVLRTLLSPFGETLTRLTPTGATDPAFQQPITTRATSNWLAPTANGQILIAGYGLELPNHRCYAALLNANGSLDARLAPTLLTDGAVDVVAAQADGSVLVGGHFDELNGQAVNNLARLTASGALDASFVPPAWLQVRQLIPLANGTLLVGQFSKTSQPTVLRLTATGALDASFYTNSSLNHLNRLLMQPDGRLLILADTISAAYNNPLPIRLLANGRRDHSYTTTANGTYDYAADAALQPDGKLVVAGSFDATNTQAIIRLLPSGQRDASFTGISILDAPNATNVALQPDGRILLVDDFWTRLRRLTATGTLDASFSANLGATAEVLAFLVQPNGRILLGNYKSFIRLLADGGPDTSFNSPTPGGYVTDVSITPTGQLIAGGYFSNFGGQGRTGVVRLLASSVLAVGSRQTNVTTQSYPNPAHNLLHLALDGAAQPRQVTLLNLLGQPVLTHTAPQPNLTLDVTTLTTGTYLLRVDYASGVATQRVTIY